jgi:hypothetical protein
VFEKAQRQRAIAMLVPARHLADRGVLRPGVSIEMAADILWIHNDPSVFHKLVRQRGWPVARFRSWLASALQAQLLGVS